MEWADVPNGVMVRDRYLYHIKAGDIVLICAVYNGIASGWVRAVSNPCRYGPYWQVRNPFEHR